MTGLTAASRAHRLQPLRDAATADAARWHFSADPTQPTPAPNMRASALISLAMLRRNSHIPRVIPVIA